ncbi:MAG: TlpA family protein disulfide reductase [Cyclobacteriaceae bacterium]
MKNILAILLLAASSCSAKPVEVEVVKFIDLEERLQGAGEEVLIVNFWATWCAPCVKELPQFEQLLQDKKDEGVKVLLVSFDFAEQLEKKVIPFKKRKNLKSEVILLDETDYNSFIDKVDPSWSGAIPATLMIDHRNGRRVFYEKEFKEGELERAFEDFINKN